MTHIFKNLSLVMPAVMGMALTGMAQVKKINVTTTAVPFLRISSDARAGAMGETGVATSADVNSQFYNVAKYAFATNKTGVGMTYTPWLRKLGLNDVYLASLAGYYKVDDNQAISVSIKYFSLGNLQMTDNSGNDLYVQHPREMSIDAGYSKKLSDHLSLGIALRYINSDIAGTGSSNGTTYKTGKAVAGDLGLYYTTVKEGKNGWSAGAAFSNLGSKVSYSSDANNQNFLPANLGLGAGHTWFTNEVHKISVTGEVNKLLVPAAPSGGSEEDMKTYNKTGVVSSWGKSFSNNAMAYSAGAEYVYDGQFSVRAGYYTDSRNMGKRNYFTTGVGVKYTAFDFNFSYLVPSGSGANTNPLSNTIRFSLLITPGAK
ncbi:MAG: type IX secretion system outer membrane channel protein PorV [Chitinophagaceae bacterium]